MVGAFLLRRAEGSASLPLMRPLLILTCLAMAVASAQVYRSVGEDGTVVYSDRPSQGATSVDLPPSSTFTPPALPALRSTGSPETDNTQSSSGAEVYQRFSVLSPAADEGIRQNAGNLPFSFDVEPRLKEGHRIRVLIDGEAVHEATESSGNLENLDRGTHTLSGEIVGKGGRVLARSDTVEFHLLRVSIDSVAPAAVPIPVPLAR